MIPLLIRQLAETNRQRASASHCTATCQSPDETPQPLREILISDRPLPTKLEGYSVDMAESGLWNTDPRRSFY